MAWNFAKEVTFRPLNDNLYTLESYCLDDSKWVMEEGPWNFRGVCAIRRVYITLADQARFSKDMDLNP